MTTVLRGKKNEGRQYFYFLITQSNSRYSNVLLVSQDPSCPQPRIEPHAHTAYP